MRVVLVVEVLPLGGPVFQFRIPQIDSGPEVFQRGSLHTVPLPLSPPGFGLPDMDDFRWILGSTGSRLASGAQPASVAGTLGWDDEPHDHDESRDHE